MKKQLKVAFVSNLFPNPVETVRGMFNYQLVNGIKKICDVTVICPMPYCPPLKILRKWYYLSQIPERYTWDGIEVYSPKYFMLPKISDLFHAVLIYNSLLQSLRSLTKVHKFDIVNAHWIYPDGVASYWACQQIGIPLVLSALGSDINYYANRPLISYQIRKSLSGCSWITSVSSALASKIEKLGIKPDKISILLNGVNFSLFKIRDKKEARHSLSISENAKVILYVGRISKEKGVDTLIDAASLIQKEVTGDVKVIIIGDGPLRNVYENKIKEKGITNNFKFLGVQQPKIISIWLGAADLLCLPSISEGCPNVIMEALCAGRPVIGSRVGGIPELIGDAYNGFLFTPGQARELADVLKKALLTVWDPFILRQSISDRSWDKVAEEYCKVYYKVIK